MDPLPHHLLTQACNNAWANHRLLAACGRLTQAEFEAPRAGFFPSLRATLNHTLTVDRYYLDAIERSLADAPVNPDFAAFFEPEQPYADCGALGAAQAASDRRLLALCEGLERSTLAAVIAVPRARRIDREPLPRLLAHLFQHQGHHRGQAHAMLAATAVVPPQLDEFFCVADAPLRAPDFAALGFTEAAIWLGAE